MNLRIVVPALLLAISGLFVQAYPNLSATTGILAVPTAATVSAEEFVGAADILFFDDTTINARIVYGLTNQFEVGAALIAGTDTAFGVNGKYRTGLMLAGFDWAVGASLITGSDVGDGMQVYFVGTRPIGLAQAGVANLIGTIGVNFTDLDSDISGIRPFIGAQLRVATATEVAGEFVLEAGDFDDSIFSLLVRQQLNPRLTGQLGLTNAFGLTGTDNTDFFLGAAYAFGE
jgi:hypothetical protein